MSGERAQRGRAADLLWFYGLLGSAFTVPAVISLAQRVFDVGLTPVLADSLRAYREFIYPISDFLLGWLKLLAQIITPEWRPPTWLYDMYALSFIGSFSAARGGIWTAPEAENYPLWMRSAGVIAAGLIGGITGLGLLAFLSPLALLDRSMDKTWRQEDRAMFAMITWLLLFAFVGALAFFAIDSQM